jgi:hypothetical protein
MLFADQTSVIIDIIRAGANRSTSVAEAWSAARVQDLLAVDAALRPPGQAQDSRAFAQRYLGNQEGIIRAALRKRYPLSAASMPIAPLPYIREWARKDSGAYQQEPQRYLVAKADRSVVEDPAMRDAYDRLLESSRISEVAPESERRARTGVKGSAVHVGYLPPIGDEPGRPLIRHYWPHDVAVVCHPSYPGEDEAAVFVAFRQASRSRSSATVNIETWRCYKRDFVEDESGLVVEWGAWQEATWSSDNETAVWEEYAGTVAPWASLRLEPPDGGYWPAAERDSYLLADELNTSRSNLEYVTDLQAHSNMVITSDTYDETEQPVGPDVPVKLRSGDGAAWITPSPALVEMRDGIAEKQRSIGAARGNDPNTYSAKPGPAESGIARLVSQFPHELTLREAREAVRRFDERLCRVLLDVADAFDVDLPLFGTEVRPRTELSPSVVFEDPSAKQSRALLNLQEGAISPAEYVVEVGIMSSLAAATEAGYSDIARLRAPASPVPSVADALVEATSAAGE